MTITNVNDKWKWILKWLMTITDDNVEVWWEDKATGRADASWFMMGDITIKNLQMLKKKLPRFR